MFRAIVILNNVKYKFDIITSTLLYNYCLYYTFVFNLLKLTIIQKRSLKYILIIMFIKYSIF